jgi:hypothetical protein
LGAVSVVRELEESACGRSHDDAIREFLRGLDARARVCVYVCVCVCMCVCRVRVVFERMGVGVRVETV